MALFITYDNDSLQDGIGAQALRIVGIYSISKTFRLNYIHSEIKSIVEEFAHSQESDTIEKSLRQFNQLFSFPESERPEKFDKVINIRNLTLRNLSKIVFKYKFCRRKVLLRVLLPFPITDKLPWVYRSAVKVITTKNQSAISRFHLPFVVAHIRFGYGWLYGEQSHLIRRKFLTPLYFSASIKEVFRKLSLPKDFHLVIHTDLSNVDSIWKPRQIATLQGYRELSGNQFAQEVLIKGRDLLTEIDLSPISNFEIKYCADVFEAFLEMCHADVLIMGTSAFSYLAGLFNKNIVVWPSIYGHSRYPRWWTERDLGINNLDELIERQVSP